MNTINFYRARDEYGYLSNFASYPVRINEELWSTTEHYFQAQKFLERKHQIDVALAQRPKAAANIGRDRNRPLRPDWEEIKDDVMRVAVLAKFTQYTELRDKLLATGDAKLVEHTINDSYWGDGGDGSGKNMLGKILMEVRDVLKTIFLLEK